jgi:hypothetical protein
MVSDREMRDRKISDLEESIRSQQAAWRADQRAARRNGVAHECDTIQGSTADHADTGAPPRAAPPPT